MKQGTVFNIQKFCINDGPGIRTTVFLKGCPLRCVWCHNPESHLIKPEIFYMPQKCIGCGKCTQVCQAHQITKEGHIFDRTLCNCLGKCTEVCPSKALEKAGTLMTVDEILTEVFKDKNYYENSGGGMTLSGGEPLMQYDFSYALLKRAKEEGLHTCMETCGWAEKERILAIAELVDIFLFDWKITNPQLHQEYTGVCQTKIKENLLALDKAGHSIILRCPIIPGINDTEEHFLGIAGIANGMEHILGIEVEPYHSLGNDKLLRLDKENLVRKFETPKEETVKKWIAEIQKHTKVIVKKG